MKIGAPRKAVKIPIGISEGATTIRLIVSAINKSILPIIVERGKIRW